MESVAASSGRRWGKLWRSSLVGLKIKFPQSSEVLRSARESSKTLQKRAVHPLSFWQLLCTTSILLVEWKSLEKSVRENNSAFVELYKFFSSLTRNDQNQRSQRHSLMNSISIFFSVFFLRSLISLSRMGRKMTEMFAADQLFFGHFSRTHMWAWGDRPRNSS